MRRPGLRGWLVASETTPPAVNATPIPHPDRLLWDVKTTCRALWLGRRTLWQLSNSGKLPCVRVGRAVRFDPDDVRAFIEANKTKRAAR